MVLVTLTAILLGLALFLSLCSDTKTEIYPFLVYFIAILSLYQTTLLGLGVVGSDIQQELYYARQAFANGWDYSGAGSLSNLSAVVGVLAPFVSLIMHIDLILVFKWVFPAVFAVVPVILYFAFRKQLQDRDALLAALFFTIIPVFNMEIASIAKSMIAEVFLALALWVIVSDLKIVYKMGILVLTIIFALMAHYTIGIVLILYLAGIALFLSFGKIFRLKALLDGLILSRVLWITVVIGVLFGACYFMVVGNGQLLGTVSYLFKFVSGNVYGIITGHPGVLPEVTSIVSMEPGASSTANYLQQQPQFVKSGIGLDFFDASLPGKIFRVFQYFTQIMIVIGAAYCFFYRKVLRPEFMAGVLAAFVLLVACIFIPYFSMIANMTRFYHLALFFLAPCFVMGFRIFGKFKLWVLTGVFLIYYIFVSGIAFEVLQIPGINKIELPYSHALSAERIGSVGIFTQDDIGCAEWLADKSDSDTMILADQNGIALISSYMSFYPRILNINNKRAAIQNTYYLFLTNWNYLHNEYITAVGLGTGARNANPLPDLKNATKVYSSGYSVVYLVEKEK